MRIATPQLGRSCAAKSSWDENDKVVICVECKSTEFLSADAWQISSPRMKKARSPRSAPWFAEMMRLRGYAWLDAAQLIKHAFGLRLIVAGVMSLARTPATKPIMMIQLCACPGSRIHVSHGISPKRRRQPDLQISEAVPPHYETPEGGVVSSAFRSGWSMRNSKPCRPTLFWLFPRRKPAVQKNSLTDELFPNLIEVRLDPKQRLLPWAIKLPKCRLAGTASPRRPSNI
jgi:hypothetical protein